MSCSNDFEAGELAEEALDRRIGALVADAPPLTDSQIEKLTGLINSAAGGQLRPTRSWATTPVVP